VRTATRCLAIVGALVAALAIACADPTSPKPSSLCSGGGTQGWDRCGGDSTQVIAVPMTNPSNGGNH
jgi:hypothetical protein